jgi:hypothetical protein
MASSCRSEFHKVGENFLLAEDLLMKNVKWEGEGGFFLVLNDGTVTIPFVGLAQEPTSRTQLLE